IVMNVSSIDTGDKKRDEHLKSADFFNAKKFMQIVFSGSSFEKTDQDGKYILHGILTIKGITKKITLDAEFGGMIRDPWGNDRSGFSLKGTLNRKDWGLNWNTILDTGGLLVGEDVNINCEVELIKANIEKNVN
ncbi:MAG: YceI family protein, partial [Ignavibacteria bacterium]|nr:YceI family protein [Ignavibacteria bacterium]